MDKASIHTLRELNNSFYRAQADSFSQSRSQPSPGWDRVVKDAGKFHTIFDLACGNMRFERYVCSRFPKGDQAFHCVDACERLVDTSLSTSFQHLDVIEALVDGRDISKVIRAPRCELTVSFGFMHHVPSADLRAKVLEALLERTKPGGVAALSFWRFTSDAKLARKARRTTAEALAKLDIDLEHGDYLVGWNDMEGVYRYCHSFEDDEIGGLLDAVSVSGKVIDRFNADGRNGALNGYAVIRRQ